jgi:hypothetical protein
MSQRLKPHNPLRIVAGMKKSALFLGLMLLAAVPSFAQYQQFGVMVGGSERTYNNSDTSAQPGLKSSFKLTSSVKEIWYGVDLEPGTMFKIKVGQIDGPVGAVSPKGQPLTSPVNGKYQHADGIIDYRFSEPFGSTGLFLGIGLYRGTAPGLSDTNFGVSGGVNGDFPISRRFGIVVEGTYHWIYLPYRPHIITATGGLRVRF